MKGPSAELGDAVARSKALSVSAAVWPWAGTLWLFFQLPVALIGVLALGLMQAGDDSTLVYTVMTIVEGVAEWVGVPLSAEALAWFSASMTIVVGIVTLLGMFMQYTLAGIHAFSGSHSGLKFLALGVCLIGYTLPVMSLLPWFFLITLLATLYPR